MKRFGLLLVVPALSLYACNGNKTKDSHEAEKDSTGTAVVPKDTTNDHDTYAETFAPNKSRYFYGPDTSVISGKISVEQLYGTAGYVEDPDEATKEEIYFLWLESPVKVFASSPEEEENGFDVTRQDVDKIQVYSTHGYDLHSMDGKMVQVKGAFFGAHTAHHHADVLMDVVELKVIR